MKFNIYASDLANDLASNLKPVLTLVSCQLQQSLEILTILVFLGLIADPGIKAIMRPKFEDGLKTGVLT